MHGDGGHLALLPAPHALHPDLVLGGRLQVAEGVLGGIAGDGGAVCPSCGDGAKSFGITAGHIPGVQEVLGRGGQRHKPSSGLILGVTGFCACRCTPACPSLCWLDIFCIKGKTGAKGDERREAGLGPELTIPREGTLQGSLSVPSWPLTAVVPSHPCPRHPILCPHSLLVHPSYRWLCPGHWHAAWGEDDLVACSCQWIEGGLAAVSSGHEQERSDWLPSAAR